MGPDEVDIRFWPLRVMVRGDRAVAALRWPLAIALVVLALTLGIAVGFQLQGSACQIWGNVSRAPFGDVAERPPRSAFEPETAPGSGKLGALLRATVHSARSFHASGCHPEIECRVERINPLVLPPIFFSSNAMVFAMMCSAKRYDKFVACFSPQCAWLGEAQMMSVRGRSFADQTRLRGYKS